MIVIPSYLLIKKTPTLPLYDERFVGYGWNKVQWIENLRMAGYNFYVFEHGFIIHCPHPMYLCWYVVRVVRNHNRDLDARMRSVQNVWKTFLRDIRKKYSGVHSFPRC